ncbi:MAG: Hsp70 family protein [Planctomycetota bacterium]
MSAPVSGEETQSDLPPRYCIGIDLGTTNCVLAFADTESDDVSVQTLPIPQWVDFDTIQSRPTLPSFHFTTHATTPVNSGSVDGYSDAQQMPNWLRASAGPSDETNQTTRAIQYGVVGEHARRAGMTLPGRQIASAKSWLSHPRVDRSANILPWHGDDDVPRRSPAWASAAYLHHLRLAWDDAYPEHPLADQDVTITLPASFDEVARELTIAAAKLAGMPRVNLIEEPQAAFYAWLDRHQTDWRSHVCTGQLILVCDIGGDTTDLTLIRVREASQANTNRTAETSDLDVDRVNDINRSADRSQSGELDTVQFHRVAVGKHLILGGDNLDLGIAKQLEDDLRQNDQPLSPSMWLQLVAAARDVKETMLAEDRPSATTVHVSASGASLLQGALDATVTADQIDRLILDGFFPHVSLDASPTEAASGFREMGLPYAADPAITRHLADFVRAHRLTGLNDPHIDSDQVDLVLFNGGVMASPAIGQRIIDNLADWFGSAPKLLDAPRLDLAVAQGAAASALVRRGRGTGVTANLARTYFMQVSVSPPRAVCVIPANAQPGQSFRLHDRPMRLSIGIPVVLPLWCSSTRLADQPGDVIELVEGEVSPLPPIETAMRDRRRKDADSIDVIIESQLSEIGTVGLYLVQVHLSDDGSTSEPKSPKRWKLDFDIRSTLQTDQVAHVGGGEVAGVTDEDTVDQCRKLISGTFVQQPSSTKPAKLMDRLQETLEQSKWSWSPLLLRQMWSILNEYSEGRRRSPSHESRWLNLTSFTLRPGYGIAVDDWRSAQTWRSVFGKLAHDDPQVRTESLILWRRIAGGLTDGQQAQLASLLMKSISKPKGSSMIAAYVESWRLVGSLERLPLATQREFLSLAQRHVHTSVRSGDHARSALHAPVWAMGRLASRVPVYGPLHLVMDIDRSTKAAQTLMQVDAADDERLRSAVGLSLVQIGRRCDDRFRDLSNQDRNDIMQWLRHHEARPHWMTMVEHGGQFDDEEQASVVGDSLPLGITLREAN